MSIPFRSVLDRCSVFLRFSDWISNVIMRLQDFLNLYKLTLYYCMSLPLRSVLDRWCVFLRFSDWVNNIIMRLLDYLYPNKLQLFNLQLSPNLCETSLNFFEEFPFPITTSPMRYLNLLISNLRLLIYHLKSQGIFQVLLIFSHLYFVFNLFSIIILYHISNSQPSFPIYSSQSKRDLWLSYVGPEVLNTNVKFFDYLRIFRTFLLIILM